MENRFIVECQILDRSIDIGGARLRLVQLLEVPERFRLYDDELGQLFDARIVWCDGRELGVELCAATRVGDGKSDRHSGLGSKFYALNKRSSD